MTGSCKDVGISSQPRVHNRSASSQLFNHGFCNCRISIPHLEVRSSRFQRSKILRDELWCPGIEKAVEVKNEIPDRSGFGAGTLLKKACSAAGLVNQNSHIYRRSAKAST